MPPHFRLVDTRDGTGGPGTATLIRQITDPFEEFDASGTRLFAVSQPTGALSYRTLKYPLGAFSLSELRATAGGVAQLS